MWDVGCYGVNTARLFAGAEPVAVRALARLGPSGVDLSLTAELASALRYQVQDYIPISLEDALLDYMILDEFEAEDHAPMLRVLAVAAQKDMVANVMAVLDRAGLEPVVVVSAACVETC